MTPIHLNRLNFYSNKLLQISKPSSAILNLTLKVKTIALAIVTIIAAFFLYLIFFDSKGKMEASLKTKPFAQLEIDSDDKKSIKFIIENLAKKDKWWLCKNAKEINKHGDKIHAVHPLKFISFILSDSQLKNFLSSALNDRFKKMVFMRGLTKELDRIHSNNNLKPLLDDFMNSIKIPSSKKEELIKLIDKKNWYNFFLYLKENSKSSGLIF